MFRKCVSLASRSRSNKFFQSGVQLQNCSTEAEDSPPNSNFLQIDIDKETGIAKLCLNRPPVNGLNFALLDEIYSAIDNIETEQKCTGMIWTSSDCKAFCAGLDLMEITDPDPDFMWKYWTLVQEVGLRLYGSQLPMINAINGHVIAGGMIIGLCADYNISAKGNFKFGLNETSFGVLPPFWLQQMLINAIGRRKGHYFIKLGKLFDLDEAVRFGLIDEVVEADQLMSRAEEEMKKWLKIPAATMAKTKTKLRARILQEMEENRESEAESKVQDFTDPETINRLKSHLAFIHGTESKTRNKTTTSTSQDTTSETQDNK